MVKLDRVRSQWLAVVYAGAGLLWLAFDRYWVLPRLLANRSDRVDAAIRWLIATQPALFLPGDPLGQWRNFSGAFLIALPLHFAIVNFIRWRLMQVADTECGIWSLPGRIVAALASCFLALTLLTGPRHDYFFYVQMWYEVWQGHDPWFLVGSRDGVVPLNAYGPLFNVFVLPYAINPLAPKLIFASLYSLFAIGNVLPLAAGRPASWPRLIALLALFWNPFPWVEIAVRGHFDILVGLASLAAVAAWNRGRDGQSGACLAAGILLKYMPITLVPFFALDRGRVRWRFLFFSIGLTIFGMELAFHIWGLSVFEPLRFAASRHSTVLSIFLFLRGRYSPLHWIGGVLNQDYLSPYVTLAALYLAWLWYRTRWPDILSASLVAALITVLLYRSGYPQYQMLPFALGTRWLVVSWHRLRGRPLIALAAASYIAWLAAFESYYANINDDYGELYWIYVRDFLGLPTFLLGCAFIAAVVRLSSPTATELVAPAASESASLFDRPPG